MMKAKKWLIGSALFPLMLYTVLFFVLLVSVLQFVFDYRVVTVFSESMVSKNDTTPSRLMIAISGIFRQHETTNSLNNDDDSDEHNVDTRSELCHKIEGQSESSFQRVWERMKPSIAKVSLVSTDWTKDIRSMKNFTDWVDESMSYFTYSRLQHTSISRPIDQTRSIGRIHSILEEKLKFPATAPPLRIVVFGGSVTNGHYCLDNIFNFTVRDDDRGSGPGNTPADQSKICAWSGRLQDMMDETFGRDVVEIKNLAVGGAKSDVSTALMEFGLIPGSTPDIIIWDHGINDALTTIDPNVKYFESSSLDAEQIFEKLQSFYQAAVSLPTSCENPDPPLVIMLDSFIGHQIRFPQISEALRTSAAVSKMLTWYPNIWGISSANTLRPYILTKVNDQKDMIGLLGSNSVTTHPGMMYHISIAWIIMFNFVNALFDNCITRDIIGTKRLSHELSNPFSGTEYLPLSHLPELNKELRMIDIPDVWKERLPEQMEYETCIEKQIAKTEASKKFTKESSLTCFYAWIVNAVLKVETPQQVYRKLEPYLVKNEGWSAYTTDREANPGGWIPPGGRESFFELKFSDVPISVHSLTIIYMQSYSDMWINSTLQIDCFFLDPFTDLNDDIVEEIDTTKPHLLDYNYTSGVVQRTDLYTSIRYIIRGYHDDETSILVPTKPPLPDRTMEENMSVLRLHFRLLNGQTFKIAGIALC